MNHATIKQGIDRIETGLPDQPDMDSLLTAGRRLKRRRQMTMLASVAAVAAAVLIPVGLLTGPANDGTDQVADNTPSPTSGNSTGQTATVASEAFGTAMAARVEALFPGVSQTANALGDHYERTDVGSRRAVASDPVDWPRVFTWTQGYELPGQYELTLSTVRTSAADLNLDNVCVRTPQTPEEETCSVTPAGDGRDLLVREGIKFDDTHQWGVNVQVTTEGGPRGTASVVNVWVVVEADSWPEAQTKIPAVSTMSDLALDPSLQLPEPSSAPATSD